MSVLLKTIILLNDYFRGIFTCYWLIINRVIVIL
mgnify:CR=1 FL=1|jgi:hypothetical protein